MGSAIPSPGVGQMLWVRFVSERGRVGGGGKSPEHIFVSGIVVLGAALPETHNKDESLIFAFY